MDKFCIFLSPCHKIILDCCNVFAILVVILDEATQKRELRVALISPGAQRQNGRYGMKRILSMIAAILAILLVVGCSQQSSNGAATSSAPSMRIGDKAGGFSTAQAEERGDYTLDMAEMAPSTEARPAEGDILPIEPPIGGVAVNPEETDRQIVYTADVGLQTKDFEAGLAWIQELTKRYQGFIQSSSVQGRNLYDRSGQGARSAHFTLRIPESGMQSLLDELKTQFNVNYTNIYTDDITAAYFDTQARLDSLRVQQERLMEMLAKAEDVQYLLEVQKELARVGYEIESLTSTLNRMKDSVAYSTVNLYLEEVVEYTAPQAIHMPFSERVRNAFSNAWKDFALFCQDFVLWLVSITPFLIILLPIALVIFLLVRRKRKASNGLGKRFLPLGKKPAAQEETNAQHDEKPEEKS